MFTFLCYFFSVLRFCVPEGFERLEMTKDTGSIRRVRLGKKIKLLSIIIEILFSKDRYVKNICRFIMEAGKVSFLL